MKAFLLAGMYIINLAMAIADIGARLPAQQICYRRRRGRVR
jgi:hypothetical protein